MDNAIELLKSLKFTNAFWVLIAPLVLMGADVVTGYLSAWVKGNVKSSVMRSGLVKKFGEITVLCLGKMFEFALGLPTIVMNVISGYIILMELVSIMENLIKMGVPVPKFVQKALTKTANEIQNEDPTKTNGKEE